MSDKLVKKTKDLLKEKKMNKALEIFDNVIKNGKKLESCEQTKAKKEYNNSKEYNNKKTKELLSLIDKLGKKEISADEFRSESQKIRDDILNSKENQELMKCALNKCSKEVKNLLSVYTNMYKYDCSEEGDQSACKKLEKANNLLKKDLTLNDYKHFLELFRNI